MIRIDTTKGQVPHRGGIILALGLIGFMSCFPLGIVAFFMYMNDRKKMQNGTMDPEGQSTAQIGGILGLISGIFGCISVCVVSIVILTPLILASTIFAHKQGPGYDTASSQCAVFEMACEQYYLNVQKYPESLEDLVMKPNDMSKNQWKGPYLSSPEIPTDPWDNPYVYQVDNDTNEFSVYSKGPDGRDGTYDDIYANE